MFQVYFRRTVWRCRQCFHQFAFELRQPIRNICQRIVRILLVIPLFIFVLDFLRIPAPVSWWLVHHFALILNLKMRLMQPCFQRLSVHLLSSSPCDWVVENELLPELADNTGTTRGTKLSVLQIILFPFLVNRGF